MLKKLFGLWAGVNVVLAGHANQQAVAAREAKLEAMGDAGRICKDMIKAEQSCGLYSYPPFAKPYCDEKATIHAQLSPDDAKVCEELAQETIRDTEKYRQSQYRIPKEQAHAGTSLPYGGSLGGGAGSDVIITVQEDSLEGNQVVRIVSAPQP